MESPAWPGGGLRNCAALQRLGQCFGAGDREPAGEVLADVGGGSAVDRGAALEEWDGLALPAGQDEVRVVAAAHDRCERGDVVAGEGDFADGGGAEVDCPQEVAEGERVCRRDRVQEPNQREGGLLV